MIRRRALLLCAAAPKPPPVYGEKGSFNSNAFGRTKMHGVNNRHVHKRTAMEARKARSSAHGKAIFETLSAVRHAVDSTTDARTLRMAQLTDEIFSKGASFVTSACNISFVQDGNPATPEVAFVGREHVGKTALLRALFKNRFAVGHSNTQKRKDAMSFFSLGECVNVVECPGYGSRSCPFHVVLQHAALIRNFVRCRPSLKMLYYCMDFNPTYGLFAQDVDVLKYLSQEVPNFTIVLTKGDLLRDEATKARASDFGQFRVAPSDITSELELNGIHHPMLVTSAFRMGGLDTLRFDIVSNAVHALPTEMLTYTEVRKLGERLLTQTEIATMRPLQIAPTEAADDARAWRRELIAEQLAEKASQLATSEAPPKAAVADGDFVEERAVSESVMSRCEGGDAEAFGAVEVNEDFFEGDGEEELGFDSPDADADRASLEMEVDELFDLSEGATGVTVVSDIKEESLSLANVQSPQQAMAIVEASAQRDELAIATEKYERNVASLTKKMENADHLAFIRATSPWRNPLLWPPNVIPTRSKRHNVMRCPSDPDNPYLTQPRFVAPRMDMYFRRPTFKKLRVRAKDKGLYHADETHAALDSPYTIPYFPTIQDVHMLPKPQHLVGISKYFSGHGEGRLEGLLALKQLRDDMINPIGDTAAIANSHLREEVMRLEDARYGEANTAETPLLNDASAGAMMSQPRKSRIAFLKPE